MPLLITVPVRSLISALLFPGMPFKLAGGRRCALGQPISACLVVIVARPWDAIGQSICWTSCFGPTAAADAGELEGRVSGVGA